MSERVEDARWRLVERLDSHEIVPPHINRRLLDEFESALREDRHFEPVEGGEWIRPPLDKPFLMECCDCGLVHALSFAFDTDGAIMFSAVRAEEASRLEAETSASGREPLGLIAAVRAEA